MNHLNPMKILYRKIKSSFVIQRKICQQTKFEKEQKKIEKDAIRKDKEASKSRKIIKTGKNLSKYKAEKVVIEKKKYFEGASLKELQQIFKPKANKEVLMRRAKNNEKVNLKKMDKILNIEMKK